MELCSMLCGSLDGRGVWGRMGTCVCMVGSLCCPPETITTLLIRNTPIQNWKWKKTKKMKWKREIPSSLSTMWRHSEKVTICSQRALTTTWPWRNLDLRCPHLQNCEEIIFCCLNSPVYGIWLWQPKPTTAWTHRGRLLPWGGRKETESREEGRGGGRDTYS